MPRLCARFAREFVITVGLLAVHHRHRAAGTDLAVGAALVAASQAIGLAAPTRARALAVAQVSTVRNLTLALVVLGAVGAPAEATAAVLAYGAVMYAGAGAVALIARVL